MRRGVGGVDVLQKVALGDLVVMRRREFITLLSGTAVTWPLNARAQQQATPVVGYFEWGAASQVAEDDFRQGLADAGYVEGRNVAIIYRSAAGQYNQLAPLAADLVRRQVSVIVAAGMIGTALAVKDVTSTIPIVVASGGDPVKYGLAESLNRPGGNVTGMTWVTSQIAGKRLELLHETVPKATTVAFLSGGPLSRRFEDEGADVVAAAKALGVQVIVAEARSESDIEAAFRSLVQRGAGALIVGSVPHFSFNSGKIVELAARHKIPAIYPFPIYLRGGGLMTYGADLKDNLRRVAVDYVGRILKGANPADLPIEQPTKFLLTINLRTAKRLGLEIPSTLLIQADRVIE
jgi:putative ABC transport system substrate-binding protein